MPHIEIYTTPTCHYCKMAKAFFQEHGLAYTEYDVQADLARREEMVKKSGQMGVPVIVIGNDLVVGFDQDKIEELVAASGQTAA